MNLFKCVLVCVVSFAKHKKLSVKLFSVPNTQLPIVGRCFAGTVWCGMRQTVSFVKLYLIETFMQIKGPYANNLILSW